MCEIHFLRLKSKKYISKLFIQRHVTRKHTSANCSNAILIRKMNVLGKKVHFRNSNVIRYVYNVWGILYVTYRMWHKLTGRFEVTAVRSTYRGHSLDYSNMSTAKPLSQLRFSNVRPPVSLNRTAVISNVQWSLLWKFESNVRSL